MDEEFRVIADWDDQSELIPRRVEVDGVAFDVLGINDKWYDPDANYFKVRAADGRIYLLRCDAADLSWSVVKVWTLDA